MSGIIVRDPVTEGFKQMLLAAGLDVEVGSAPAALNVDGDGRLIDPYSIVYPMAAIEDAIRGTLGQPERSAGLPYQVTSVGRTARSAQIQADRIREAVTERAPGGAFLHPLDAGTAMVVCGRRSSEIGLAEPTNGLWQVPDSYVLDVQAI